MSWLSKKVKKIVGKKTYEKVKKVAPLALAGVIDPATAGSIAITSKTVDEIEKAKKKMEPEMPTPETAATTDTQAIDTAAQEAAALEAVRLKKRRGFKSTIKTGPAGVTIPAATTKTMLG